MTSEASITRLVVGPWDSNCYVVACPETGEAAIIDPAAEAERILEAVQRLEVKYILLTHTHRDHTGALAEIRAATGAPLGVHHTEAGDLAPELVLAHDDTIAVGKTNLRVVHTPGHSPGSVCFFVDGHLISGDTLFPNGPGHSRSPDAMHQLIDGITRQLFLLSEDTVIHPGHGAATTVGKEKRAYALFSSRSHEAGLCGDVLWMPVDEYEGL